MSLHNKLAKRKVFIKALNLLEKYHLKLYMLFYEDGLLNYFIHLSSKIILFFKKKSRLLSFKNCWKYY